MPPKQQIKIKQEVQQQRSSSPDISNAEWGLVIGALALTDIIQALLDLVAVGVAINRFIDIMVGGFLWLYLHVRAPTALKGKRLLTLIGSFVAEEIPILDALPFWTFDGFYYYSAYKTEKKLEQSPVGNTVIKNVNK